MTARLRRAAVYQRLAAWAERRHLRRVRAGGVLAGDLILLWVGTCTAIVVLGEAHPWGVLLVMVAAIILTDRWWLTYNHRLVTKERSSHDGGSNGTTGP